MPNFRYTELFINNGLIHEYIDRILKDERISLNDSMIANFVEIYYGKVIESRPKAIFSTKFKLFDSGSNAVVVGEASRHGLSEYDAERQLGGGLRGLTRCANHRTDRRVSKVHERKSETKLAVRAAKKQGICLGR